MEAYETASDTQSTDSSGSGFADSLKDWRNWADAGAAVGGVVVGTLAGALLGAVINVVRGV